MTKLRQVAPKGEFDIVESERVLGTVTKRTVSEVAKTTESFGERYRQNDQRSLVISPVDERRKIGEEADDGDVEAEDNIQSWTLKADLTDKGLKVGPQHESLKKTVLLWDHWT
ncbi:hypothetical protein JCM11641_004664 [Rhodosporidiobolus odoratus]